MTNPSLVYLLMPPGHTAFANTGGQYRVGAISSQGKKVWRPVAVEPASPALLTHAGIVTSVTREKTLFTKPTLCIIMANCSGGHAVATRLAALTRCTAIK
jgi:hypothetical protein